MKERQDRIEAAIRRWIQDYTSLKVGGIAHRELVKVVSGIVDAEALQKTAKKAKGDGL